MYSLICPDCGIIRGITIEMIIHEKILVCGLCGCVFRPIRPKVRPDEKDIIVSLILKQGTVNGKQHD